MSRTQSAEEIHQNIIIKPVPRTTNYDSDICNYGSALQFVINTTVKESGRLLTIMTNPATERDFYSSCNATFHNRKPSPYQNNERISS
jgi:hypothetical protein